jgi:hypothetical protein
VQAKPTQEVSTDPAADPTNNTNYDPAAVTLPILSGQISGSPQFELPPAALAHDANIVGLAHDAVTGLSLSICAGALATNTAVAGGVFGGGSSPVAGFPGLIAINGLPAGTYRVVVDDCPGTPDNYAPSVINSVVVTAGAIDSVGNVLVNPRPLVPGAPTNVVAVPHASSATVYWLAPGNGGGSAISSYVVTTSPGGIQTAVPPPTGLDSPSTTITGLQPGQSYWFTVAAMNQQGTGPSSAASTPVVVGIPDPPRTPKANGAKATLHMRWSPPKNTGGVPVTVSGKKRQAKLENLPPGFYSFFVRAVNARGPGEYAASNIVWVGKRSDRPPTT